MSAFKDMVEWDISNVFLDTDFFAEKHTIIIDGHTYNANIILDDYTEQDRKASASDYSQGLHVNEVMLYADYKDFGFLPKKGLEIWIDNKEYIINRASCDMGQIELKLGAIKE